MKSVSWYVIWIIESDHGLLYLILIIIMVVLILPTLVEADSNGSQNCTDCIYTLSPAEWMLILGVRQREDTKYCMGFISLEFDRLWNPYWESVNWSKSNCQLCAITNWSRLTQTFTGPCLKERNAAFFRKHCLVLVWSSTAQSGVRGPAQGHLSGDNEKFTFASFLFFFYVIVNEISLGFGLLTKQD